jgi:DNA-binding CsgD family transcriptional regulator
VLIGRESERATIDELLELARRGRSQVLVLTGEPGIGKTALLHYARDRATGMRVLAVAGVETETDLAFGGLHALLLPALDLLDRIPDRQQDALSAALALTASGEPDRLAANAGVLSLLAELAMDQPVLVLVDDAHWLDRASAEAIAFAARRLAGEDLALIATVRDTEPSRFDYRALPQLRLPPLTHDASLAVLRERHGDALAPSVVRTLAEVANGNPLALVELPAALSTDQLEGRAPLQEPIPVAERIQAAFLRRFELLPPDSRRSLVVAAAGAGAPLAAVRTAAKSVGGGSFEPAETEGLVVLGSTLTFRHPLLRAAIYGAASPAERRKAHDALAASLQDEPDLRAWHLAAAAEGPDEEIAAALEAAADRALERGGHASRAQALERAAELSPNENERGRRLCLAARAADWAGQGKHALELCERALPIVSDPVVHADLIRQLQATGDWHGRNFGTTILEHEAAAVSELAPNVAAGLLIDVLNAHVRVLDYAGGAAVAGRLEALVDRLDSWWGPRAHGAIAETWLWFGDWQRADEHSEGLLRDPVAAASYTGDLVVTERYDEARHALSESLTLGERDGNILRIAAAKGFSAQLHLAVGAITDAKALASEGLMLAEALDVDFWVAFNETTLATIDAIQGRDDECRARVARIFDLRRDKDMRLSAQVALAILALGTGQLDEVVELLAPVHEEVRASGLAEPALFPYAPDLIEAYARLGRPREANEVLEWFEGLAEASGRRWARATAARCRGYLADADDVDLEFGRSLAAHEEVESPFERGRTELLYGERLRRANRRRDARPHLRAALGLFDDLGAAPWRERAQNELRATGERVPRREPDAREQLTPQELQIALLVAEGKTNREIGASIFLSPKTIEFHLTRVYRKLDIHSRRELIKQFAGGSGELESVVA